MQCIGFSKTLFELAHNTVLGRSKKRFILLSQQTMTTMRPTGDDHDFNLLHITQQNKGVHMQLTTVQQELGRMAEELRIADKELTRVAKELTLAEEITRMTKEILMKQQRIHFLEKELLRANKVLDCWHGHNDLKGVIGKQEPLTFVYHHLPPIHVIEAIAESVMAMVGNRKLSTTEALQLHFDDKHPIIGQQFMAFLRKNIQANHYLIENEVVEAGMHMWYHCIFDLTLL